MLSVLALNVSAPPEARARELLAWLWVEGEEDDVWVLTEVSPSPGSRLIARVCRAAGFAVHVTDARLGGGLGVMVVVRDPALQGEVEDVEGLSVLPGRVLPLRVSRREGGEIRLLAVYGAASDPVRYSSSVQRQRKREWIAAFDAWLGEWLAGDPDAPAVLVGDLNLVDPLHDDELRYVLAEETEFLAKLTASTSPGGHGLVDAYRLRHPDAREVSWVDHSGVGCRYDHAFVSADLAPAVVSCDLLHGAREAGLTDHSALRVRLR